MILGGDLVDVYTTYKKSTNEIIEWLLCAGTKGKVKFDRTRRRAPVFTAGELRFLADRVLEEAIFVPDTILRPFRLTIEARETMSCYYQKLTHGRDQCVDETHAFFNILLRDIYRDFKGEKKVPKRPRRNSGNASHVECANPFDCLTHQTKELESHGADCVHYDTPTTIESTSIVALESEGMDSAQAPRPGSDNLVEFMNICTYLLQIDCLSNIVKDLYERAAEGKQSLAVAALTTNVVYQCSEELSRDLQQHGIFDPAQLQERHYLLVEGLPSEKNHKGLTPEYTDPQLSSAPTISALQRIWLSLVAFKTYVKADLATESPSAPCCQACIKHPFQDPMLCFGLQGPPKDADHHHHDTCLEDMLQSLHAHIVRVRKSQPSIRFRTPLLRDLNEFIRADDANPSLACQLSFGLHLLLESYKAYLTGGEPSAAPGTNCAKCAKRANPRIQSLKFAGDLKRHLEQMMSEPCAPCECLRVNGTQVAQQLKNLHFMLQDYVRTPRFDLLAQSPWIAGQHVLDHLMLGLKYGLQAWHHGYFVGLVLHVYNALIGAGVLSRDEIPVLEGLCTHFEDPVFMGARESPNVYSCYKRWTGGRVNFSTHRSGSMAQQQQTAAAVASAAAAAKRWHMCSVPDASHGGDHKRRSFTAARMSLFSLLAEGCHFLDAEVFARTVGGREPGHGPKSARANAHKHRTANSNCNLTQHVRRIRDVLTAELHPTAPTPTPTPSPDSTAPALTPPSNPSPTPHHTSPALTNPIAIYRLSLQTLGRISDANHSADEQGLLCRCMPERCLRACEAYHRAVLVARQGRAVLLEDRIACESCRDCLVEMFGGLERESVEWGVV